MYSQMKKNTPTDNNIPRTPYNTSHDDDSTEHSSQHIQLCNNPCCFFCIMKEQNPSLRKSKISTCFKEMPQRDSQEHVLVLSGLWNIAMTQPNDPEFPSLGIFNCMAKLIIKGTKNKHWLLQNQNIYIPYYAAHIIGSYTMHKEEFAQIAIRSGVIPPLLDLMKGKISWVEQRVAVRALGHLASYKSTFDLVSAYEAELVKSTMNLASSCLGKIYVEFVSVKRRVEYHRNLLTRGLGDLEMENRKAEEWASQLQCWSIYLLNCFASKDSKSLELICKKVFLNDLCDMWGGLINNTSPGGFGLIRILCYNNLGRKKIAESPKVVKSLCNLSRSCDDWQYLGIDCLLLLLKDQNTRYKIIDIDNVDVVSCLVDLIELRRLGDKSNVGDTITKVLVQLLEHNNKDCYKFYSKTNLISLDSKMDRRNKERLMSEVKLKEKMVSAKLIKKEGNKLFSLGKVEEAVLKYCEALEVCPLKYRNERMVIYSNKAQCSLLLKDPDSAISDSTRALCLCNPANTDGKSLWRRSQAYDMKGMAKESLMDCVMFMNGFVKSNENKRVKVSYHVARMFCKQMDATWLFRNACSKSKSKVIHKIEGDYESSNESRFEDQTYEHKKNFMPGLCPIMEEPFHVKEGRRRKMERARRRLKKGVVVARLM
ncbi:unnamed protein product [Vicia faba]|uniref:Protein unc-45 homolog B n=1 Tax=Vicia faba TaxID=3906 RepID=A0AAV0ZLI0_VICFA|nr:unnamed protein product [Vicia faba]